MGTIGRLARTLMSGGRTPNTTTRSRRAGPARRAGTTPTTGTPRGVGALVRRFLR